MQALWERVRSGLPTVVVGAIPPAPKQVQLIRVACGHAEPALQPILSLSSQLGVLDAVEMAAVRTPLRRRLLGDSARPVSGGALVRAIKDRSTHSPFGVGLSSLERCDGGTRDVLLRLATRAEGLPLILCFDDVPNEDLDLELLAEVRRVHGDGAIHLDPIQSFAPRNLPADALLLLHAGAFLGGSFTVEELSRLTGQAPAAVLGGLQLASTRDAPLEDHGDDTFEIEADLVEVLNRNLLPSLARRWEAERPPAASDDDETTLLDIFVGSDPTVLDHLLHSRQAAAAGAYSQALAYARQATEALGSEDKDHSVWVELLAELAALQWASGAPGQAMGAVAEAVRLLRPDDDRALTEGVLETEAGIAWDLWGEHAERALAATLRLADAHDDPVDKATYDVDRAAALGRLGRWEEALPLLVESRSVFAGTDGPRALRRRAEVDHCLATAGLHTDLDEPDQHCADAEQAYEALEDRGAIGRVWETRGRLALRRGEGAQAASWFLRAAVPLADAGDGLALARVAAGLAGSMEAHGRATETLSWMDRAIHLNRRDAEGIAWARLALQAFMSTVNVSDRDQLLDDMRRMSLEVSALEGELGRAVLTQGL